MENISTLSLPLPLAGMKGDHLGALLALARLYAPEKPLRFALHASYGTARDKAARLPAGVLVQESAIVVVGSLVFLVSGVGACQVRPSHLRTLARLFAMSAREANAWEINPAWLPASLVTGMAEGIASPFLPPAFVSACPCEAIVLLTDERARRSEDVALALSLSSSLLFPLNRLTALITAYARRCYPHLPLLMLSSTGDAVLPSPTVPADGMAPGRTGRKRHAVSIKEGALPACSIMIL